MSGGLYIVFFVFYFKIKFKLDIICSASWDNPSHGDFFFLNGWFISFLQNNICIDTTNWDMTPRESQTTRKTTRLQRPTKLQRSSSRKKKNHTHTPDVLKLSFEIIQIIIGAFTQERVLPQGALAFQCGLWLDSILPEMIDHCLWAQEAFSHEGAQKKSLSNRAGSVLHSLIKNAFPGQKW